MVSICWVWLMANNEGSLNNSELEHQALVFGRYLLHQAPNQSSQDLYALLVTTEQQPLTTAEQRLLTLSLRHSWCLPFVEAGLVLVKPSSEIRRRIYVMLGVLECQPDYHAYFLPQGRSWWYAFSIIYSLIKSWLKTILGIVLLKAYGV